ncbi:MAG: DUF3465 domain-containing protein [Candidatus Eremiobacteraeota bacterium]|nr:DUF3465 domain-containing protein [Candidatus Eremiobacteraeota bacterium]
MGKLPKSLAILGALLLGACQSSSSTLADAQRVCQSGASHVEVHFSGTIARYLGTHYSQSGEHEGFLIMPSGSTNSLMVEDNVNLSGFIPMRRGDAVELQGQYECNDSVIHWTHHDPSGRHVGGFVIVNGRRFQ